MAFEAPVESGWDPDKFNGPEGGRYHVRIAHIDEDGGEKGEMIADFEVLAGTTPNQEGLRHREWFYKTMKAMGKIHTFAIALGMTTADELKRMQAEGRSPTYDFEAKKGAHLCIELTPETYDGKTRQKTNFSLFHIASPKVANWPKNLGALKADGIVLPVAPPPAAASSTPATAPKAAPAGIDLAGVV